jgi:hypothetical protein
MKLVLNFSRNAVAGVKPSASVKCRARHAAILDGDQLAIYATNRRARAGMKPDAISRYGGSCKPAPNPAVQIGRLDLLLGRRRRDPKATY